MFWTVTLREKGKATALETETCTSDEVSQWCQRGKRRATELGVTVLVEFKPREQIFVFAPEKAQANPQ